ncbi:MAG TPA: hypothetical protein VHX49_03685 [Candidatus Acidoferrales bacterium]|jgi:hypothetical protein|nr:hypothetical protein [Candidatus Acidoferrales bacterium]
MADPADSQSSHFLDDYEIAQPKSYATFVPQHARTGAELRAGTSPGSFVEPWSDAKEEAPWKQAFEPKEFAGPRHESGFAADAPKSGPIVRAIWVVHGMGQQIQFETLDSLTQGVLSAAKLTPGTKPRMRTVKVGDQTLQRVELDVNGASDPAHKYELHLYEAYWAPMTEGVAKLTDVVSFLLDGALRGLLNCVSSFKRALFGVMEGFRIPPHTAIWITLALVILGALTVINGVIVAAGAAKTKLPVLAGGSLDVYWPQLTAIASCMTAVAFTFGAVLFLAELTKPRPEKLSRAIRLTLSILVWSDFGCTILAILGAAFVMLTVKLLNWLPSRYGSLFLGMHRAQLQAFVTFAILSCALLVAFAMARRGYLRSSESELREDPLLLGLLFVVFLLHLACIVVPAWLLAGHRFDVPPYRVWSIVYNSVWVWPLLIVLSAKIRTILIEYVGDVAIYVTPNKLDRFQEVRTKIKDLARTVASAVYTACEEGTNHRFLYNQVAIVGHSLGSVIAYDTLNRLMLDDWLSNNHLGIANRTNSLITFGSPLEKTAFFFTIQGKDSLRIRERLAATVQPLIQSYRMFRKFPWINIYSRNDIVSGKLEFYDLPRMQKPSEIPPRAVHNLVDKDACVPLVAHVDYWKNPLLWTNLYNHIAP